jgi:hypothetical protein
MENFWYYYIGIIIILRQINIYNGHLVYFVVIWYIFYRFGIWYNDKSGNPGFQSHKLHSDQLRSDKSQLNKLWPEKLWLDSLL